MEERFMSCPVCHGSRWVCENHPMLSWPNECDTGAGDPCPVGNVAQPPVMPNDFVADEEADDLPDTYTQKDPASTKA
jgi:hypothetical protein